MTQEQIWQIAIAAQMKRHATKLVREILRAEGKRRLWEVNLRPLVSFDLHLWPPHQRAEALARRSRGETLMDIARSFNVSHTTIARLMAH